MLLEPDIIVLGVIDPVVCAPAFQPRQCRTTYQGCSGVDIPGFALSPRACRRQFQLVSLKMLNGILQALPATYNADFVPHQFLNAMDKFLHIQVSCVLIRLLNLRIVAWIVVRGVAGGRSAHGVRSPSAEDETLQQGIAGQPVGPMDSGARSLTGRV